MIIRLVDVVLILLFGFLAISDIQVKRQLRLPGPSESETVQQASETVFLFVKIDPADRYRLVLDDQELLAVADVEVLRGGLLDASRQIREAGNQPVIIIDPDPQATVQRTISVFDICEEENLVKSINMDLSLQTEQPLLNIQ